MVSDSFVLSPRLARLSPVGMAVRRQPSGGHQNLEIGREGRPERAPGQGRIPTASVQLHDRRSPAPPTASRIAARARRPIEWSPATQQWLDFLARLLAQAAQGEATVPGSGGTPKSS